MHDGYLICSWWLRDDRVANGRYLLVTFKCWGFLGFVRAPGGKSTLGGPEIDDRLLHQKVAFLVLGLLSKSNSVLRRVYFSLIWFCDVLQYAGYEDDRYRDRIGIEAGG